MTSGINTTIPSLYTGLLNPQTGSASAAVPSTAFPTIGSAAGLSTSGVSGASSGLPGLSSDVIALLQQLDPAQSNPTTSLLNGASTASGSLDSLLGVSSSGDSAEALLNQSENAIVAQVYASALQAAYQGAAQHSAQAVSPVQATLAQYQAALNAYSGNATLQHAFGAGDTLIA